jgi:hypothetical protein
MTNGNAGMIISSFRHQKFNSVLRIRSPVLWSLNLQGPFRGVNSVPRIRGPFRGVNSVPRIRGPFRGVINIRLKLVFINKFRFMIILLSRFKSIYGPANQKKGG